MLKSQERSAADVEYLSVHSMVINMNNKKYLLCINTHYFHFQYATLLLYRYIAKNKASQVKK